MQPELSIIREQKQRLIKDYFTYSLSDAEFWLYMRVFDPEFPRTCRVLDSEAKLTELQLYLGDAT